jgi:hypothetical protein
MTTRQLILGILTLVTIVSLAGIYAWVAMQRYEKETEINFQTEMEKTQIEATKEVEKTRIEQSHKNERTEKRLNWIPWYKEEPKD